jgi:hypothetical protein
VAGSKRVRSVETHSQWHLTYSVDDVCDFRKGFANLIALASRVLDEDLKSVAHDPILET